MGDLVDGDALGLEAKGTASLGKSSSCFMRVKRSSEAAATTTHPQQARRGIVVITGETKDVGRRFGHQNWRLHSRGILVMKRGSIRWKPTRKEPIT